MNDMYNNGFNTVGVGDHVPPKKACLTGADYADDKNRGSGDLFPVLGMTPMSYWPKEWKEMREEGLKSQRKKKSYDTFEERPLLVFSDDKLIEEGDPICGGQPSMSDKIRFS